MYFRSLESIKTLLLQTYKIHFNSVYYFHCMFFVQDFLVDFLQTTLAYNFCDQCYIQIIVAFTENFNVFFIILLENKQICSKTNQ